MDWAQDPELMATFRAEVEERLAALSAGLLELEAHPAPRQRLAGLFRDAHTVKGSARMLGALDVLHLAHSAEDLLGAVRDGRLAVRRDLVDLLLLACDAMARAMPGAASPLDGPELEPLLDALRRALAGEEPVRAPALPAAPAQVEEPEGAAEQRGGESVRVLASRVYDLLDAVGEAELGARRVARVAARVSGLLAEHAPGALSAALGELSELTEESTDRLGAIREQAMGLAMVPVGRTFAGLPRLVREVAAATGKDVALRLSGESVELDKQVIDGIADALRHLVTNAVDHGCESPAERVVAGKPPRAVVSVSARSVGGTAVIEVSDDGAGVDEDAVRAAAVRRGLLTAGAGAGPPLASVLCTPGFSTADAVTETSGRGVGLDVVALAVAQLGGQVDVTSVAGQGTSFTLTLPVTLGVLRCLVARVGAERYAVALSAVSESVSLRGAPVHELAGAAVLAREGTGVPLIELAGALGTPGAGEPKAAVVVGSGQTRVAWAVDALEGEWEFVAKDLGGFLGRIPGISGATIDSDGSVICLIEPRELAEQVGAGDRIRRSVAREAPELRASPARVLVVEDSVGVRELERAILEAAGYEVVTAVDGAAGAERLTGDPVDAVISDVEMPGMDGFEFTRAIRRTPRWEQVPVIIMTSRGDDADRRAGLEAGADAYLLKSGFDQDALVGTVRRLVGR